jgi:hypothetical protein
VLLGDAAQDVVVATHFGSAHDDRHERMVSPHLIDDVVGSDILADTREVTAGHIAEGDARVTYLPWRLPLSGGRSRRF